MKESKFNILLKIHKYQIKGIARKHACNTTFPEEEMESYLIEEFWNCCNDFNHLKDVKLKTYVEKRLNNRAINIRKTRVFKDYDEHILLKDDNENDDNAATFEVVFGHHTDKNDLEDEVLYGKEKDQLQLISYLTDPDKVTDSVTTAIVKEFLNSDNPNPNSIGKKLGLHHSTVIRKLRKLAKNYDELQFGNRHRYLSV